ncbi:MAG TPA: glycosyl hydrolase [Verrucomicrobiae bacterium]
MTTLAAIAALTAASPSGAAQTAAASTEEFLSSIGVCTHIAQGVDNPEKVAACLRGAGIRNIRDDGTTSQAALQAYIAVHKLSGAKVSLLPVNGNIAASLREYEELAAEGALLAVEGPNEPNNFRVTYKGAKSSPSNSLPVAEFQADLYQAVKADPKLAGIPVFASSEAGGSQPNNCGLQFLKIPAGAGTLMPDGTTFGDYANTHNYVCDHLSGIVDNNAWDAEDPAVNGRWDGMYVEYGHTWWSHGFNGYPTNDLAKLPRVTTETGWPTRGENSIYEVEQGKLFLNLYLAAFKRGWRYTFIYMLHDDPVQGFWGFFFTDYSPKPSATCLHNLSAILAGDASPAPGSLDYSIPDEPPTVHDLLLQKDNHTFELVVWGERAKGNSDVTIKLDSPTPKLNIYDPTTGISPTRTLNGADSVPLTLSDHPLILEIQNIPR